MSNTVMFDAMLLASRWQGDLPLREAIFYLMRDVRSGCCWTTDEEGQFKVALAILAGKLQDDDKEWFDAQIAGLTALSALLQAAQAGLAVTADSLETVAKQGESYRREYSLMALWHDSKDEV